MHYAIFITIFMLQTSLIESYNRLQMCPTPAKNLILEIMNITGRKESTVRKWLYGSTRPDKATCAAIEIATNNSFEDIIEDYHCRTMVPSPAQAFRERIQKTTNKSMDSIVRYLNGKSVPDYPTKKIISEEFNTPISILFP